MSLGNGALNVSRCSREVSMATLQAGTTPSETPNEHRRTETSPEEIHVLT